MKRYAVWNKVDPIITPIGEVLSAEQWMARYPVAALNTITVVCAAGEVNGAFFGTLGQMRKTYEDMGADFSACTSNEEILAAIEAYEDELNNPVESDEISTDERIAAALEAQVLLAMDDATV